MTTYVLSFVHSISFCDSSSSLKIVPQTDSELLRVVTVMGKLRAYAPPFAVSCTVSGMAREKPAFVATLNDSAPPAFVSPDAMSPIATLPTPTVAAVLVVLSVAVTPVASSHSFATFTTIVTTSPAVGRPLTLSLTV